MQVDVQILVCAVLAALFLGRFWAVLGTRNDNDPQRLNPFASPARQEANSVPKQNALPRLQPPALPPHSLAGGLAQIKTALPAFEEKQFLQETRDIFGSIVSAYATGHLTLVSDYLSPAVMGSFQLSVSTRKAAGQMAETRISQIKEAEVTAARTEGAHAYLTVRFVSEQQNILRDSTGATIGGTEGQYEEVTDTWTFARDTQKPASKWIVVETRT